ncbi:MAG: cytochrome c oxidase assembly protein, partial [Micromonosporaceae bacterium]
RGALVAGGLVLAGAVMLLVLRLADALPEAPLPGLSDPGPVTRWGLPLVTLLGRLAAVATLGSLIATAFLTPGLVGGDRRTDGRTVSPAGYRWLRGASWAAGVWCLASAGQLVLLLSDLAGVPPSKIFGGTALQVAWELDPGRALLLVVAGTAVVAVAARVVLSVTSAALLAGLAVAMLLPPVFTGHASATGNHILAVDSLLWHVVAAAVWAGGLYALLLARRLPGLPGAASRYSRAAGWCFAIVAVSGTVNALSRLDLSDLDTGYGRVVLAKVAALGGLGLLGLWQRRRGLVALRTGVPGAFRRYAVVELLLFAATFGLAAALARTPPPVSLASESSAAALLGYQPPSGPPTARSILLDWLPDPLFLGAAALAVGLYAAGFWRLRRAGTGWPPLRLVSWSAGWLVVGLATSSGLAAYAPLMFSVHMAQHLALMTLAPILMVLGAPVTMALRALRRGSEPGLRGPRDWLRLALHSRYMRVLAHPVVALAILVVSLFAMYFTGLYELALRSHATHLGMLLHLLLTGYLFYWTVIGVDPTPHRVAPPVRLLVLFAGMGFHAFFGVALMQSGVAMAPDWYAALDLPWLPDPLADQKAAGGIAWSFGEIPSLVVAIALVVQWLRVDEREARQFDRAAARAVAAGDPSLDPHEAYNAYLKRLAEADRQRSAGE